MADDVKPEVIKKTQDSLGKYFKKPPLTEKLLRKPPFRFLHDIVSAVIKETGFLSGLFTEDELNSDSIKNKEAKLAYLTKLIDVVKLATGANLTVRASKIISGQEATKTNELLQAIGRALDKKISSAEAIEQYKKGLEKGKSSSKSKSSVTKEEKRGSSKDASQKRAGKEKSREEKRKVSNESNAVIVEEPRKTEKQDVQRNIETEVPPAEPPQEKIPSSAHRRRSSSAKPKQSAPPLESNGKPNSATLDKRADEDRKKQKESENKLKRNGESNESQTQVIETVQDKEDAKRSETKSATSKTKDNKEIKDNKANEISEKAEEKESEIKLSEVPLQSLEKPDQSPPIPETFPSESNKDARISYLNFRPRTSLRPPSARPISARPAAPRIRGKTEMIVNEEMLTPMGNISVIVENSDLKEDDDAEDMVVMESKGGGDSLENSGNYKVDEQLTQEHGHLVAQILETQKELVNNDNVDVIPKKTNISWDTSSKRDVVAKEIDKLRNTIQTLTRATNPLGKLLDYFQEDVEIMQKELLDWRSQYQQVSEQLKIEKTKTQELIEPMKEALKEIDDNMKAQLDKICQAKSQIMKNDQRIQTLLNGRV